VVSIVLKTLQFSSDSSPTARFKQIGMKGEKTAHLDGCEIKKNI